LEDKPMFANVLRPLALLGLLLSISSPAHAYLDPATGSIIVQTIIAAVAGWAAYSRSFTARAREFFGRIVRGRDKTGSE
jgi:hypothetical protein